MGILKKLKEVCDAHKPLHYHAEYGKPKWKLYHTFILKGNNNGIKQIEEMLQNYARDPVHNKINLSLKIKTTNGKGLMLNQIIFNDLIEQKSTNGDGRTLANAVELAVITAIQKEICTAEDTNNPQRDKKYGSEYFERRTKTFNDWIDAFNYSAIAIRKLMGVGETQSKLNGWRFVHDATERNDPIARIFSKEAELIGLRKDAFCPADIYVVKESEEQKIIKKFAELFTKKATSELMTDSDKRNHVSWFNTILYTCFIGGAIGSTRFSARSLIPISLKKPKSNSVNVKLFNDKLSPYPFYAVDKLHCNATMVGGKEIGVFSFDTGGRTRDDITIQHRTFPSGYSIAQTEVTNDGTGSGGRAGKSPTWYIDKVLSKYGYHRIQSLNEIGENSPGKWTKKLVEDANLWFNKWNTVSKLQTNSISVCPKETYTIDTFTNLLKDANTSKEKAENLCSHIQGLNMLHFLATNPNKLSSIVTKLVNGANKATAYNSFYVKIY